MSFFHRLAGIIVFCILGSYAVGAQDTLAQIAKEKKVKILPVPSFGYSPETGSYIGAVALFTFNLYQDSRTRISNAKVEFNYTWRKQIITECAWNYFFKEEKWYSQGTLHYSKYPDLYYGIGEYTRQSSEVFYQSNRIIADVNLLRNIDRRFFIGPKIRYLNYYSLTYNQQINYAELKDAATAGAGVTLLKDTRDNLLNATRGIYAEVTSAYNNAAGNGYAKLYLDGRTYRRFTPGLVIGLRFYNEGTFGNPPFYDLALIGGDKRARGYYFGRFRDRNLSTLQAEARFKIIGRFGLAAFGGLTKLYPQFDALSFQEMKPNYGGGIRFVIDRKQNINLRIDYAIGNDGQDGFYIAFGESF